MKIYLYFTFISFLLTGCLLTPKDPPNAVRPGDLIPLNPVESVIQLSDVSGSFNQTKAEAIFLEGIRNEQALRKDECAFYQDDLSTTKNETKPEVIWSAVSAGKVLMGAAGADKALIELKKDEYNRYLLNLNKQVAPGFYQVSVEGSMRDGHILVPGFRVMGISMPEVIEGVRLNDQTPNPATIFELKKGELKLGWNSQSFPNDKTIFLVEVLARKNNILFTLQCVTLEPQTTSRLSWKIPASYMNQMPAAELAQVNISRIHIRDSEGEKFFVRFKGVRQYAISASIVE